MTYEEAGEAAKTAFVEMAELYLASLSDEKRDALEEALGACGEIGFELAKDAAGRVLLDALELT